MNTCIDCGCDLTQADNNAIPYAERIGYARDNDGNKVCYACCGLRDRAALRNLPVGGKFSGYLTEPGDGIPNSAVGWIDGPFTFGNWPGSLSTPVHSVKASRHNMSGQRLDFWLQIEGNYFHGVKVMRYGQLCTLTRVAPW